MKKENIIKKFMFYSIASLTGIIVLPTLGILAPTFILSGILMPIAGIIDLIGYIFGYDIPIVVFQIGTFTLNPILGFIVSIIAGVLFYIIGIGIWKLLFKYIYIISERKKMLEV